MSARLYKITSPNSQCFYVGSTRHTLNRRFSLHKSGYKRYTNGKFHWISVFGIFDKGDARIELIEEFDDITKEDLLCKEGSFIMGCGAECVNIVLPGRKFLK